MASKRHVLYVRVSPEAYNRMSNIASRTNLSLAAVAELAINQGLGMNDTAVDRAREAIRSLHSRGPVPQLYQVTAGDE